MGRQKVETNKRKVNEIEKVIPYFLPGGKAFSLAPGFELKYWSRKGKRTENQEIPTGYRKAFLWELLRFYPIISFKTHL